MSKTLKYIFIGIIVLGVLFLLSYFIFTDGTPGALIAGLAAGFAAFKSKAFNMKSLKEEISDIEGEHTTKRKEWDQIKDEYDSRFRALKARMDYLDYSSLRIREKIENLDEQEQQDLKALENKSIEEKLRLLTEF